MICISLIGNIKQFSYISWPLIYSLHVHFFYPLFLWAQWFFFVELCKYFMHSEYLYFFWLLFVNVFFHLLGCFVDFSLCLCNYTKPLFFVVRYRLFPFCSILLFFSSLIEVLKLWSNIKISIHVERPISTCELTRGTVRWSFYYFLLSFYDISILFNILVLLTSTTERCPLFLLHLFFSW